MSKKYVVRISLLVMCALFLSGCSFDTPSVYCKPTEFSCLINKSVLNINAVKSNIGYWSMVNLTCQVSAIVFGILATLMLALQGDTNKKWTRPIGIVATTLVTGVSTALSNFHVPENVDKLIDVAIKMTESVNNFDRDIELVKAGLSQEEFEVKYNSNEEVRLKTNNIVNDFSNHQAKLKVGLYRIKGTAARLNPASAIDSLSQPENNYQAN